MCYTRYFPFVGVQTKVHKGQTLREIEDEEGGPVKESMVGMAAVQRALRRKKGQGVTLD